VFVRDRALRRGWDLLPPRSAAGPCDNHYHINGKSHAHRVWSMMKAWHSGLVLLLLLCAGVDAAAVEGPYLYDSQWGVNGSSNGEFYRPGGIAADTTGGVYVADRLNHRVQVFDGASGAFTLAWGGPGTGDGQFQYPYDVVLSPSGDVYVADGYNHRIQRFGSTGIVAGVWGGQGDLDGQFDTPQGIGVDGAGNVYVADSNNHRVQKFSPDGAYLDQWGAPARGPARMMDARDTCISVPGFRSDL